jgi:hypothetical protein
MHLLCFDDARLMASWPTPHEWDMITCFVDILHQYEEATLAMESETEASITWAFPMMDSLMMSRVGPDMLRKDQTEGRVRFGEPGPPVTTP